jgi:hypothetical protein
MISVLKSKRVECVTSWMVKMKNIYKAIVTKTERKRPLEKPSYR